MRIWLSLACVGLLASCARNSEIAPVDNVPLQQRLTQVAALHNTGKYDEFKSYFAKGATVQLPATPRPASPTQYLQALAINPYQLSISETEFVYSLPGRAATRSTIVATSPGRFNLKERATVDWVLENGYWKIARIAVADWPQIVGTWRRAGHRGEGSIELRILPGNTYVVYVGEDYSVPAFRGNYTLEGNKITFVDTSANDAKTFENGAGSYMYQRTALGVNLRKVEEQNSWRADRYDGDWTAGH